MDFYYDTGVSCDSCISNWFFFQIILIFTLVKFVMVQVILIALNATINIFWILFFNNAFNAKLIIVRRVQALISALSAKII